MNPVIQVLIIRNIALHEPVLRFLANDFEMVTRAIETATENLNPTLTKDNMTDTLVLLTTDVGYFNLMNQTDHILLMAVDIESRSGLQSLIELLKKDPTFACIEEINKEDPQKPRDENNKDNSDDSDSFFLDAEGRIIPEVLWGFNPITGGS